MVTSYLEKHKRTYNVSKRVCVYEQRYKAYRVEHVPSWLDLVQRLKDKGEKVVRFSFEGYWLDVGRSEVYRRAQEEFEFREDVFRLGRKD